MVSAEVLVANSSLNYLIEAGHTVMAYDVSETNLSRLVNLGAQAADSPKAMTQACEVVFSSLPGPREVE